MNDLVALIAGVTGAIGSALARELAARQDHWKVLGISRNAPAHPIDGVEYLTMDMGQQRQSQDLVHSLRHVTHIFYCGRATHGEQLLESAEDNLRLLDNLVRTVETYSDVLNHVHLVQGGKYYGVHVGPFPTPAAEEDARAAIPNFNYAQQDYLESRSADTNWHWTASRPNTLVHFSPDNARNLVSSLGTYAAISRELGAALDFPGPPGAYTSLTQVTSIDLLARAIAWMSVSPECVNQAFNVTNTDLFRWDSIWPHLAEAFSMPCGTVRPLRLVDTMAEHESVWQAIVDRYGLRTGSLNRVVNWGYLDATLERYWDEVFSHNKCRRLGFHDYDESEEKILMLLEQYQAAGILPR